MAAGDWIYDIMQTNVYEGAGRKRKVNFDKVWELLKMNGGDEIVANLSSDKEATAGRKIMTASNFLRGAARRQRGINVFSRNGKSRFHAAPPEWLSHYNLRNA